MELVGDSIWDIPNVVLKSFQYGIPVLSHISRNACMVAYIDQCLSPSSGQVLIGSFDSSMIKSYDFLVVSSERYKSVVHKDLSKTSQHAGATSK